jgi:hypothetical protein
MFTGNKNLNYQAVSQADGVNDSSIGPNSDVSDGESSLLLSSVPLSPEPRTGSNTPPANRRGESGDSNSPLDRNENTRASTERRIMTPVIARRGAAASSGSGDGGGRNNRTSSERALSGFFVCSVIISYIAAIVFGSFGYSSLSNRVVFLTNEVNDLNVYISNQQTQNDHLISDIQKQLINQQMSITRLSNTSNAYVLDELHDTRLNLFDQMLVTQSSVHLELEVYIIHIYIYTYIYTYIYLYTYM